MPNQLPPGGWKGIDLLQQVTNLAPGDQLIILQTIPNAGGIVPITTASTVIVNESFSADALPTGIQPTDTILVKRGTDLYKVDIGDIAAGVLDNRAALSVVGNPTNAAAGGVDITAGSNNTVLRRASNALSFGKVARADLANSAAVSVIGRSANSSGAPGDIAAASNNQVLKRKSNALVFGQVETDDIAAQAVTSDEIDMSDLIGALISANPGDVFDDAIHTVQLLSPMDLNNLPARSGWYRVLASGSTNIPAGAGGRLIIEHVVFESTDIMQRCTRTSNGDVWQRTKADSTWTAWQKIN